MSKPLGGKTIAQCLKSGKTILDILNQYELHNEKKLSKNPQDMWFHERLTRGNAEYNLKKSGIQQGMFLVRESVNIPGRFVLSVVHNRSIHHFQIKNSPYLGCYSIDNGPPFVGLDELINFYRSGPNGLPTQLTTICTGSPLKASLRQYGEDTVIHQVISEKLDLGMFSEILNHSKRPDLDIRNVNGRTALHEACARGLNKLVFALYEGGADVRIRDAEGNTALHIACRKNHVETCKILMQQCFARSQDRCSSTGWVALHEASAHGNHLCIDVLLQNGAACQPRSVNGETPADLARKAKHRQCVQGLERHQPPKPHLSSAYWLHNSVDRQKAVEYLEHAGLRDGCFLVRISKRNPGQHVLTMSFDKTVFNYEIKNRVISNKTLHYIDDGPYFTSLEYLVDYYCQWSDGLPAELTIPVPPASCRNQLPPAMRNGGKSMVNDRPPAMTRSLPPVVHKNIPPPGYPQAPPSVPSTKYYQGRSPSPPPAGLKEIDPANIELGRELGQGEFGSVLKGVWINESGVKAPVALKTLHGDHINSAEAEFRREAEVMMGLDHLCIVKLYGVCRGETLMMVQELVALGSALDYILDYPGTVGLNDFKLWGAQIASGMNYLEGKGFVHRDLALRNILLASKQLVKISDFGLSRAVGAESDYYKASAGGRWPVKWYAPESINYGTFSSSSDVWSYGVTLWEIFSKGDQPYENMTGAQVVQFIEDDNRRLRQPHGCPDKVYEIMLQCWAYEASARPTFKRLHNKFCNDPEYFNVQVPGHHLTA